MFAPEVSSGQSLYSPHDERDACGVGFVVHMKGTRSHDIVRKALHVLINLEHRGACGCEANTGDGAGILIQPPDAFFRKNVSFTLPAAGSYGAGLVFLPHDPKDRGRIKELIAKVAEEEGQKVLGWRDVPTDNRLVGDSARATQPVFEQVFIGAADSIGLSAGARRAKAEAGLYDGGLQIELKGNLAAMLSAAQNATRSPETGDLEMQIAMVAGVRFEPVICGL